MMSRISQSQGGRRVRNSKANTMAGSLSRDQHGTAVTSAQPSIAHAGSGVNSDHTLSVHELTKNESTYGAALDSMKDFLDRRTLRYM